MMTHPGFGAHESPLGAARALLARGWTVFPADHPDAATRCTGAAVRCREGRCTAATDPRQRGKHPGIARWSSVTAPVDDAQARAWFGEQAGPRNIAIACGPSGLVVIDEDRLGGLADYAASVSERVPATFAVRTGRGAHYYFAAPVGPDGVPLPVGNAPGALAAWGCDVRGGDAGSRSRSGGYVIGPGSTHASGARYVAEHPDAPVAALPGWLIEATRAPAADGPVPTAEAGSVPVSRWDDDIRYGRAGELLAQFARHCDEVTEPGNAFRWGLFCAARDGWRLVDLGLIAEPDMLDRLAAVVARVWDAAPDDDDNKIVMEEARAAATASPWALTPRSPDGWARSFGDPQVIHPESHDRSDRNAVTSENDTPNHTTDGNRPLMIDYVESPPGEIVTEDPEAITDSITETERRRARRLAAEIEKQEIAAAARAALVAREQVAPARVTLDQLRTGASIGYLVADMLYRDGLAVIFGAPGAGKSFLGLDLALSLCAGVDWRGQALIGRDGGRGRAHYVMAEGAGVNGLRIDAWLHYHGLSDDRLDGRFVPYVEPIMLTESGIARYLPDVTADRPDLVILDTRNLMFVGRESQAEDYGAMLRALHALRRAAGGAAVVLIDHSGLADPSRPRGSNAEAGGVDTMVKVINEDGLRTATTVRDRNAAPGAEWTYALSPVDTVARPVGTAAPVVCVPATRVPTWTGGHQWWTDELPQAATDAVNGAHDAQGRLHTGRRPALAILRVLRAVADDAGHTPAEIRAMLAEGPVPFTRSHVYAAIGLLKVAGLLDANGARLVLVSWLLPDATEIDS